MPEEDLEHYINSWASPHTPATPTAAASDCSTASICDDAANGTGDVLAKPNSTQKQQQQLGGYHHHLHHHYHYHHHYYHHAKAKHSHAHRARYPQPEATATATATASSDFPPESSGASALDAVASDVDGQLQDPLTWHSTNTSNSINAAPSALGPISAGASSAWLSELLGTHGVGQEWFGTIPDTDVARRWSQRRSTFASSAPEDDEFARYNPHWDDMITFRQSRVRVPRERAWSGSEASLDDGTTDHHSARGKGWRLLPMAANTVGRSLCLTMLPVAVVLLWCSVPLKTDAVLSGGGEEKEKLNFWFFLFFYYGIYNAVALALVTQIFHVYSLTWWPRSMSGVMANVISWLFSTLLGALVYLLDTGIERDPLTWTALTLLTLLLPVAISFATIQRHHRRSRRQHVGVDDEQRPLMATSTEWRTPASYRRFLWFCSSFLLWYAALAAGEYLAYIYIETLPHTTKDGFYYVYSWIATVNILSALASWVVTTKIRSWPLQYIYTLYFFTTYFIFYRNLFARLQNPEQVVFLQLGSSLWVVLIYPLRMASPVYRILASICRWGDDYSYETYVRQLGRAFFLRTKAENATMLGFLCWVTILHFGPNSRHYPYFKFEPKDDEFNYEYGLTMRASIFVWASELAAGRIVRFIFRHAYGLNIGSEAVYDFRRYPHVVPVMVLVTIHVLQNILFGMIHLDFS